MSKVVSSVGCRVPGVEHRTKSAKLESAQLSRLLLRTPHSVAALRGTRHPAPDTRHSTARGTTLLELALVLAVSLLIASALASLLNVHCKMLTVSASYRFLSQQAPQLGLLLTKTMGNADDFRIYGNLGDAVADRNHVLTGPVVRLWMREPGAAPRTAILSFAAGGTANGLCYYLASPSGTFPASASWKMPSGDLTSATFDDTTGILLVTLKGSNHDQITFAAEKK
jgi:hypothetical protein